MPKLAQPISIRWSTAVVVLVAAAVSWAATVRADEISDAKRLLRSSDPKARSCAIDLLVDADSRRAVRPLEDAIRRSRIDMEKMAKAIDKLDVVYMAAYNNAQSAERQGLTYRAAAYWEQVSTAVHAWRTQAKVMNGHLSVVAEAGAALGRFRDPGALQRIETGARREADPLIRQMYIRALAATGQIRSLPVLLEVLGDRDPRARAMAVRAILPHAGRRAVAEAALGLVEDKAWTVRLGAYRLLARAPLDVAVAALVEGVSRETGEMAAALDALLASLTGEHFDGEALAWRAWFKEHESSIREGTYECRAQPASRRSGTHSVPTFFRIPIASTNVLFAIDFSGSMREDLTLRDPRMNRLREEHGLPETRLGYAVAELIRIVQALPDGARFNIVAYGDDARRLSKRPLNASKNTRRQAVKWVKKQDTEWLTNIWAALRTAFDDHMGRGGSRRHIQLPDTIVFLTDGVATRGRFQHTDSLAMLVTLWNLSSDVVIHTVGIGEGHDAELLARLSSDTGGLYVDISKGTQSGSLHRPGVPLGEQRPAVSASLRSIRKGLSSDDWEERLAATRRLGRLGDWGEALLPALGSALGDEDGDVQEAVAVALVRVGVKALPLVTPHLASDHEDRAVLAASVLERMGPMAAPAVPDLILCAQRGEECCQIGAARALGAIGFAAKDALPVLEALALSASSDVVEFARDALERIRSAPEGRTYREFNPT